MGSSCSALSRDWSGSDAASFEHVVIGGGNPSGAPQQHHVQQEDDADDEGVLQSPASTVGQLTRVNSLSTESAPTANVPPSRTDVEVGYHATAKDTATDLRHSFAQNDFKQLLEFTATSAVSSDSSASTQRAQNKHTTMRRNDSVNNGSSVRLAMGAGGGLSSSAASVHHNRHTPKLVASSFVSSSVMLSNGPDDDFVLSPATTAAIAAAATTTAAVEISSFQHHDGNNKKAVAQAQQQQQQQLGGMKSQHQHPDKCNRSLDGNSTTQGVVPWSIFNADDVIQLTERSPSTSISGGGDAGGDCVLLSPLVRPEQEWHTAAFT